MKCFVALLFIFQTVCVQKTVTYSVRATRNVAFEEWLSKLDPSTKGTENSPLCVGYPDGFYAFPGECSSNYYACSGGTQYDLTCANGYVFEPAIGNCINPTNAPCKSTTESTTSTTPKTTVAPFSCGADGNYAIGNCSSNYYICVNGDLYPQTCPAGVFNPVILSCTSVETAGCLTTTPIPTTQFTCTADGNFPSADCSSTYYNCVSGVQYTQTCPGGAVFYNGKCTAPGNNPFCQTFF